MKRNHIMKFTGIIIASALMTTLLPSKVSAQFSLSVGISIRTAPPALPVYTQPPCPYDGWLWTPGYWAYGDAGYYWVPGVWVRPPAVGLLWTPGYWGYAGGIYGWHGGYWGPHVGFYGGVNYGCGYIGTGYAGGMWQGGSFRYNTAVTNVNTTVIHNTYINKTVINNTTVINNRTSFNGGPNGTSARPSVQEQSYARENHVQPTSEQFNHNQTMSRDRNQLASVNGGRPSTVAMNRVGGQRFNPQGRAAAATPNRPTANMSGQNRPATATNNNRPMNNTHPANNTRPMNNNAMARTNTPHPASNNARPMPANNSRPMPANNSHPMAGNRPQNVHPTPHANPQHPSGGGGGHRGRER